jgi:hypothetical protein
MLEAVFYSSSLPPPLPLLQSSCLPPCLAEGVAMPVTSPLCHCGGRVVAEPRVQGVREWLHGHGCLVALLNELFIDFLLHVIVELQPYRGGVSSIQELRHVGLSSTSFSSVPCRHRITWMSTASMVGRAAVSMQCVPHCSMLSGSGGDSRKPAAD